MSAMTVDERKIAVLGVGRIGEALIAGLLSSGWREPGELSASSRREERVAELAERYGVRATSSNIEAAAGASLVVVSVKPQDIEALLGEIGTAITPEQTVLTVAAATPTATIERYLAAGVPVVRAMPNTPSTVHEGIAGLCAGAHADDEHVTLASEALAHLGRVVLVPERAMDAVTAVSGSGPAYFALLAEAMIEAGLLLGLSREISTQLVVQTMLGTAKQLRDEGLHPVELREMVTSPGGTTIAAIRELESAGVRAAFLNAIQAAMTRARELTGGSSGESSRSSSIPRSRASASSTSTVSATGTSSRNASRSSKERSTSLRAASKAGSSAEPSAASACATATGSSPSSAIRRATSLASASRPTTSSASAAQ